MQPGPDPNQVRCSKCQAPLGQSIGRCPFCGTEVGAAPDPSRQFNPAYVGLSEENRARMGRSARAPKPASSKMGAAVFVAAALLLIAVGGTAAFFLLREPIDVASAQSAAPPPVELPPPPPLNINGVLLKDGPAIDPTDVLYLVRARVGEGVAPTDVNLLAIRVHRARLGKVNVEDAQASVTYEYLVTRRDPRAAKADERKAERVALTLRADAPAVERKDEDWKTKTVPEPTCVWNAAWRAALASGLSDKDYLDVTYGIAAKGTGTVWLFSVPDRPETERRIDGETCAIKLSKQ